MCSEKNLEMFSFSMIAVWFKGTFPLRRLHFSYFLFILHIPKKYLWIEVLKFPLCPEDFRVFHLYILSGKITCNQVENEKLSLALIFKGTTSTLMKMQVLEKKAGKKLQHPPT